MQQQGRDDEALDIYEEVLRNYPNSAAADEATAELQKMYEEYSTKKSTTPKEKVLINQKIIERWPESKLGERARMRLQKLQAQVSDSVVDDDLPLDLPVGDTPTPDSENVQLAEPNAPLEPEQEIEPQAVPEEVAQPAVVEPELSVAEPESPDASEDRSEARDKEPDSREELGSDYRRQVDEVVRECDSIGQRCETMKSRFGVLRTQPHHETYFLEKYFGILKNVLTRLDSVTTQRTELLAAFEERNVSADSWKDKMSTACSSICTGNRSQYRDLTLCKSAVAGKTAWADYFAAYPDGACSISRKSMKEASP